MLAGLKIGPLGAGLLLLAAGPVLADAGCGGLEAPGKPQVEITVEPAERPPVVAVSAAEIRRRAGTLGSGLVEAKTRGLTVNQMAGEARYQLSQVTLPNGRACAALAGIVVRLANQEVTILVDRRYPEGSCERRVILEHEREHLRINNEALRDGERPLRDALQAVARRWAGRWVPVGETKRLDREVQGAVEEAVRRIRAEAERRHARIDTPAAYRETQRRCRDW